MLRKTRSGKIAGIDLPIPDNTAGMPIRSDYMPQNVYKEIESVSSKIKALIAKDRLDKKIEKKT